MKPLQDHPFKPCPRACITLTREATCLRLRDTAYAAVHCVAGVRNKTTVQERNILDFEFQRITLELVSVSVTDLVKFLWPTSTRRRGIYCYGVIIVLTTVIVKRAHCTWHCTTHSRSSIAVASGCSLINLVPAGFLPTGAAQQDRRHDCVPAADPPWTACDRRQTSGHGRRTSASFATGEAARGSVSTGLRKRC